MNIQLKDFIRETLVQIVSGIREAQKHADTSGSLISPASIEPSPTDDKVYGYLYPPEQMRSAYRPIVHLTKFDVAVVASEQNDSGGKVGVSVLSITADFKGGSGASKTSESRITFGVPIVLPSAENRNG